MGEGPSEVHLEDRRCLLDPAGVVVSMFEQLYVTPSAVVKFYHSILF